MQMYLRITGCLALGIFAALAQQQPAAAPPANKAQIEQIVKEYILQHPEVLLESVRLYQEREKAAQQQKSKDALASRQPDLLNDPSSPSTRPAAAKPSDEITIVEFFDYRCGFCRRVNPTLMKLVADDPKLRVIFKEFPILGPESVVAAKAGLAAAKQGKYLAFHQAMMTTTATVNAQTVEQVAKQVGLDWSQMKTDMESPEVAKTIEKNTALATALDVSATPTFVVGSEMVSAALDADGFKKLMAKAQAGPKATNH
jgi:protein-disulfide isomerase